MTGEVSSPHNAGRIAPGVCRDKRGLRVSLTGLALALLVFFADQASKAWALSSLSEYQRVDILGRFFGLQLVFNPGAAWSLGGSSTWLVTILQALLACGISFYLFRKVDDYAWGIALGLMLGGAFGNLYDRLFRAPGFAHGHVVDFFVLPHWPIFNVADVFIVTGCCLIVLFVLSNRPASRAAARAASAGPRDE
ncbi:signal peptidase II [Dermabacteraceae bacterium TAE3-ERU27]|nr:signal peptidase II [Dermabacteraceae bacterium TAE3-ERU27]